MLAIDSETTGIDFHHGALPFLVTVCDHEQNQQFWEWDVDPLTRKPLLIYSDLKEIDKVIQEEENLVFQNATFDIKAISLILPKLKWDWSKIDDTLYSSHLLESNLPKNLTALTLRTLGIDLQPYEDEMEEAVKEARRIAKKEYPDWMIAKEGFSCMPSAKATTKKNEEKVWKFDCWLPRAITKERNYPKDHRWWTVTSEYANTDSAATIAIFLNHQKRIKEKKLEKIYRERIKLLPIVDSMQNCGITIDKGRFKELQNRFTEGSNQCEKVCLNIGGDELEKLPKNGTSNAVKKLLFETFNLPSDVKTKKGNPSINKYQIEMWLLTLDPKNKPYHFVKNLRDYRKQKTCLTFLESYQKYQIDWVLNCQSNPTGTNTLRWSSSNPNNQQISKDGDYNLRYCFGPSKDREWWALDYDNIELRIPAYEAGEEMMIEIFEKPDEAPYFGSYHLLIFDLLHPEKWDKNDPEGLLKAKEKYKSTWYSWTKNFNFADQYGAQPESGTADRAAHVDGAQIKILNKLQNRTKLNDHFINMANQKGYVETIPDKEIDPERGYPLYCSRTDWGSISPTIPFSYHVQGTACWVMFRAMIKVQEYLDSLTLDVHIVMNVHDELVIDFPLRKNLGNLPKVRKIKSIMESMGDCIGVPLTCGIDYHPQNWKEGLAV